MKNTIHTIIGAAAITLAAFTSEGQNGAPTYVPQSFQLPSPLTGTTNLATPMSIYVGKQDKLDFQFLTSSADSSSTTNETIVGGWAVNTPGTNALASCDTNNPVTLSANIVGTTPLLCCSNKITAGGSGYFIIYQVNGKANSIVTNGPSWYGVKISAP